MGRISTKSLKQDDELDQLLEEEVEEELEESEEEEEAEEEAYVVPKSVKRRLKSQKKPKVFYVTLKEAITYSLDGQTFKLNQTVELPYSKLSKFKDNGWFTVRY